MPSSVMPARHRGEARNAATFSDLAKAVTSNATGMGRQAAVIVAASGLVLSSGVAANAADLQPQRDVAASSVSLASSRAEVVAPAGSLVSFNRTPVKVNAKPVVVPQAPVVEAPAAPAPVVEAPVAPAPVAAQAPAVQAAVAVVAQAPAPAAAPAAATAPVAPAPAPAAPVAPASSGVAATIAAAAKGQLGVTQDCTRLVSNSLAAAGINFHGWPAGYLSLGRTVSAGEAVPGDLIYYADGGMGMAHIAVYIGGGQAVHGGFNGNSTVIAPAELGSGGVYIRVGG
ncbi:NlpC/P60 family protein [Arthrobacter agilis]|uniref:NlpC/P60 family protein n=1 Tax=Arthrobacter agilis TaxID=37921 RepID=UPI002784F89C|nr:NlpC/P60 family protein [Arthrobacter agilis]MDQ0733594.1 cell wall-associated NlpC family hydrolase [Arthrobacter agilis]